MAVSTNRRSRLALPYPAGTGTQVVTWINAVTRKDEVMPSESRFQPMELDKIHEDIRKLMAETMRLNEEASRGSAAGEQFLMMALASLSGLAGAATCVSLAILIKFH
jgi:hypothetical protein